MALLTLRSASLSFSVENFEGVALLGNILDRKLILTCPLLIGLGLVLVTRKCTESRIECSKSYLEPRNLEQNLAIVFTKLDFLTLKQG